MTRDEATVKIGVDHSSVGIGLASVQAKFDGFAHDFRHSINHLFKEFGGAFTAGGIVAGIERTLEHFKDIKNTAEALEISPEFLQGMTHIASKEITGGAEGFSKAIGQLSVNLGQAQEGSKEATDKFKKLGISLFEINKLDAEQMFYLIADRIKAIPSPAERAAASFELFGRAGKNMAGFLSQGSEEIRKLVNSVDKLDAKKIKDLTDSLATIEDTKNTVTVGIGKTLSAFSEFFQDLGRLSSGHMFQALEEEGIQAAEAIEKKKKEQAELEAAAGEAEIRRVQEAADKQAAIDEKERARQEQIAWQKLRLIQEEAKVIKEAFEERRAADQHHLESFMPTIHELAQRGVFGRQARGIERLERNIKRDFERGDVNKANQDISARDKLMDTLAGRGVIPEREERRREAEAAIRTEQHLADIRNGKAALKVKSEIVDN